MTTPQLIAALREHAKSSDALFPDLQDCILNAADLLEAQGLVIAAVKPCEEILKEVREEGWPPDKLLKLKKIWMPFLDLQKALRHLDGDKP